MTAFKLIAIIPLYGCKDVFSKKLTIGYPYQFYHRYNIIVNDNLSEIESVTVDQSKSAPENLYKPNNGIFVNFSAVVGKNGSGKSTLFELFYQVIYMLGTRHHDKILEKAVDSLRKKLINLQKDLGGLFKGTDLNYKLINVSALIILISGFILSTGSLIKPKSALLILRPVINSIISISTKCLLFTNTLISFS